ncbi:MAG: HAD-IA family hydrolase [Rhizobacter sp.]|nr:HAD-IA family hydrolase [Burkholderiales bacterium]
MNIVFDFGNVLFEWNPARLITHHYDAPDGKAQFAEALADTLVNHQDWLDFDLGLIDSQQLAERSARRLGLNADGLRAFVDRIPHVLPVFEPTIALMNELADGLHGAHRIVYLSNMPSAFATVLEARCPWISRFEDGVFSGRVKLAKPDAAIYAAAEAQLNLDPADTLFLDDSPRNVDAARARGWRAEIIDQPHNDQSVRKALIAHGVLRNSGQTQM